MFYKITEQIDPEIQKKWDEFSRTGGKGKRPFPAGPACTTIISNTKKKGSKKWNPPRK